MFHLRQLKTINKKKLLSKIKIIVFAFIINSTVFFVFPVYYYYKNIKNNSSKNVSYNVKITKININKKKKIKKKKIKIKLVRQIYKKSKKQDSRFKLSLSARGSGIGLNSSDLKNIVYEEGDVDTLPVLLNPEDIEIPELAIQNGLSGTFEILLIVDELGKVHNPKYISGPKEYNFPAVIVNSALYLRFKPAYKNNIPVKCKIIIPFRF